MLTSVKPEQVKAGSILFSNINDSKAMVTKVHQYVKKENLWTASGKYLMVSPYLEVDMFVITEVKHYFKKRLDVCTKKDILYEWFLLS